MSTGLAATVLTAAALPAQAAASPGWRLFASSHFGPAGNENVLNSVVELSKNKCLGVRQLSGRGPARQ
jgi:hypothetical protein